jgi:enoyl-CoA hydratase/carnithine racemase
MAVTDFPAEKEILADGQLEWTAEDGVGVITLNRPEKLNALTRGMMTEIRRLCGAVTQRPDIRVVVFVGIGRGFCAGQDLAEHAEEGTVTAKLAGAFRADMLDAVAGLPQPTIAALHGYVLGRGLMLALACDLRFAADDAKLGYPEINYGIIPGGGGTQRLTKVVGPSRAMHLVLTGDRIDATEARSWGLVTKVVPRQELTTTAVTAARQLAAVPNDATVLAKAAVHLAVDTPLRDGILSEKALSAVATADPSWKSNSVSPSRKLAFSVL